MMDFERGRTPCGHSTSEIPAAALSSGESVGRTSRTVGA
jgi:hypothetical protein